MKLSNHFTGRQARVRFFSLGKLTGYVVRLAGPGRKTRYLFRVTPGSAERNARRFVNGGT